MQFFKYINYFFYLSVNWNPRIASHIIRNEIRGEKKYAIQTTGEDELHSLERKGIDISHATIYMPAGYDMLEIIFEEIKKYQLTHFLDMGCGKGRAMCVAAYYHFKKLTGIDFYKALCQSANNNLQKTKKIFPLLSYKVIHNDAFYYDIPDDVDCIFLFNPFDETIMSGVIENIEISLQKYPRELFVIYLNPLNKELFLQKGYREVFHIQKLKYLEGSVLKRSYDKPDL